MYRWVALGTYNLCYFPLHILKTYGKDIFTPQFKFHHPSFFPLPLLCFWMQQNYDSIVLGTHVIVIPLHFFKSKKYSIKSWFCMQNTQRNFDFVEYFVHKIIILLSMLYTFYIKQWKYVFVVIWDFYTKSTIVVQRVHTIAMAMGRTFS